MANKQTKTIEGKLPVVDFYDKLPARYQKLISQQGLALLLREGITDEKEENIIAALYGGIEGHATVASAMLLVQSRDLLCQLLIEQYRTNAILEKILAEAKHG